MTGLVRNRRGRRVRGISMVESAISIVIVGTMLVAAFSAVEAIVAKRYQSLWRMQGLHLARALRAEIVTMPYEDPNLPTLVLGCESGEPCSDRTTFDDVDDFNGYQQTPPRARDGSALTVDSTWSWGVTVEWVSPSDPGGATVLIESNVKRITVRVIHNQIPVATLMGLRTNVDP